MRMLLVSLIAAAALVPVSALACEGMDHSAMKPIVKSVTLAQVQPHFEKKSATFVDANSGEFRTKNGVIPGAILLTSSGSYDAAKELPADKTTPLVFYCSNTKCGASKKAAERAFNAGYSDVSYLPDGLMGWKSSGNKTALPNS